VVGEVFVPQAHAAGAQAEVDWGRALVDLGGVRCELRLFFMRSCSSGAAFCAASRVETQQAFLECHVEAFEWFGGVFERVRYDNLGSAVKKVLRGRRRVESDRFVALRSHYLYESSFTTPGIEGAHEKGGVEGEVGRFRRNHLVPVPALASLEELNALLLAGCEADLDRRIAGRAQTVGEALEHERGLEGGIACPELLLEQEGAIETAVGPLDLAERGELGDRLALGRLERGASGHLPRQSTHSGRPAIGSRQLVRTGFAPSSCQAARSMMSR